MKNILTHIVRFLIGTIIMVLVFGLIHLINNIPIFTILFGVIGIIFLIIFTYTIGWGICDDIKNKYFR